LFSFTYLLFNYLLKAANVALGTVRQFLEKESNQFDRIIFCCFLEKDEKVYEELLPQYFPLGFFFFFE